MRRERGPAPEDASLGRGGCERAEQPAASDGKAKSQRRKAEGGRASVEHGPLPSMRFGEAR